MLSLIPGRTLRSLQESRRIAILRSTGRRRSRTEDDEAGDRSGAERRCRQHRRVSARAPVSGYPPRQYWWLLASWQYDTPDRCRRSRRRNCLGCHSDESSHSNSSGQRSRRGRECCGDCFRDPPRRLPAPLRRTDWFHADPNTSSQRNVVQRRVLEPRWRRCVARRMSTMVSPARKKPATNRLSIGTVPRCQSMNRALRRPSKVG